jgi:hypothetical protein
VHLLAEEERIPVELSGAAMPGRSKILCCKFQPLERSFKPQ